MHVVSPNNIPRCRSHKIPVPKLRRNHDVEMLQVPQVWETIPMPKMRL